MPNADAVLLVDLSHSLTTAYLLKTATGSEPFIPAPRAGFKIRLRMFFISMKGAETVDATLNGTRSGVSTTVFGQSVTAQVGASVPLPGYVDFDEATGVNAVLSGPSTNGCHFSAYYQVVSINA